MRTQTLNTYVKSKLKEYYQKPLRFNTLLEESKKDSRLAELSQAHFLLKKDQVRADKFAQFTKMKYLVEEFAYSNQKYVYQFNKQVEARRELNGYARKCLKKVFEVDKLSAYRVAKELGTNQSNLSEFYYKNKDNKLDAKKVLNKYGW